MYKLEIKHNVLKIYIKEILHFQVKHSDIVGMQSYIRDDTQYLFCIEFYMKNKATIKLEYDKLEKWTQILGLLDEKEVIKL